jgi:alpha-galactosidase
MQALFLRSLPADAVLQHHKPTPMRHRFFNSALLLIPALTPQAADSPLSHGPFIGHVTDHNARIWVRAERDCSLKLTVRDDSEVVWEQHEEATAESDHCVVFDVDGLSQTTRYRFAVTGPDGSASGWFETAPHPDSPSVVRIAFGSCAREDESTAAVWRRMGQAGADAVVLLGDTPYIDSTELGVQQRRYREFAKAPAMAELLSHTPWYATWDDHDFGRNDTDGNLPGKENSRHAFIEYHANPSAGDGVQGIYTSFRRGPVEVFLLDTRTFAATEPSPFEPQRPTLLGAGQWRWLEAGLKASSATFKVLASGMIWNEATRPNKPDHWMSYPHEREALFRMVARHGVSGVMLVGGDVHRSRLLQHPAQDTAGYALWEWITSPMHGSVIEAADAPHPALVHDAGEPNAFLLMSFDTTCSPALATGQALNAAGDELFSRRVSVDELRSDRGSRSHRTPLSARKPLKVFVLAGQSNMEGHAEVRVLDYMGEDPQTASLLAEIKNADGTHRMIKDTWISFLTGLDGRIDGENREVHGRLTTGFGSQWARNYSKPGGKIGPELAFGITLQKALDQPILIIKTAWGGQSLHTDFRSPSSGPYAPTEANQKRFDTDEEMRELKQATGARYRQMIDHVRFVLGDIRRVYPEYDTEQGYELAGMAWFQGWNDMVDRGTYPNREQPGGYDEYSVCMANFIRDVRKDLGAPEMPFVIGVMGVGGPLQEDSGYRAVHANFRTAMAAPAELPEFKGNVIAVQTAPYWDQRLAAIDEKRQELRAKSHALRTENAGHENADGKMTQEDIEQFLAEYEKQLIDEEERDLEQRAKSNAGYHYLGSAKTYSQIGKAFAEALTELQ